MNFTRLLGSLLGSVGGGAVGGMVGGRTGRMIGSMAGSMLAGRGLGRGKGSKLGGLGGLFGGGKDDDDSRNELAGSGGDLDNGQAEILIQAMVNSAKSDGEVTKDEVDNIIEQLGELQSDEEAYLREQLDGPFVDAGSFASSVPGGLGPQAYAVSVIAIDVDNQHEINYLRDLAGGLGLDDETVDSIHGELGVEL